MMENKKHILKRVFACVLVVLMTVTAVPMSGFVGLELPKWSEMFAARASALSENGYTYTVTSGKATITAVNSTIKGNVVLPDTLGGYPVTELGSKLFYGRTDLTGITIPKSVERIGNNAFEETKSLEKVIWNAENVEDFGYDNRVFFNVGKDSTGIDVVFSDNVKRIPAYLFSYSDYDDYYDTNDRCHHSCANVKSVSMSDSVIGIGDYAFYGCTANASVFKLSDNLEKIGKGAFYHSAWFGVQPYGDVYVGKVYYGYRGTMPANTNVVVKDGTKGIASGALSQYRNLSGITIPDSITSIGYDAFGDAWKEDSHNCSVFINDLSAWCRIDFENPFSNPLVYSENMYLNGQKVTTIEIPDEITEVKDYAFYGFDSLTSVVIPESVTKIGDAAFSHCDRITNLTISNNVKIVGNEAFEYCKNLSDVSVGKGVERIGTVAFGYTAVRSIIIPDGVREVGICAFSGCRFLSSVTIGNGIKTISKSTFSSCPNLKTIKIGKNLKTIESSAFLELSSIPEIYYAGSEADWKKISIDQSNDMILRATMHYNADITHTHSYTAKITKKATCTENGVKTYTCNCGKTVTKSIPATGHKYKTENQAASCTSIGVSIKKCTVCGKVEYANTTPATGHTLKTDVEPATFTESGLSITSCKTCGTITKATLIKRIASVTLSATKYAYNGKTQTPTVVVKDSAGKVLKNKTDYTVSYASGRKNPGKYAVKVTFKGNYTGTKTLYFTISPIAPSLTVTAGAKKATLKWNKQTGATGYVVYMATSKTGKYSKIAVLKGNSAVSYTKTGLTTGRTYYFKIASYTTSGTSYIYSAWSSVKGVKIK